MARNNENLQLIKAYHSYKNKFRLAYILLGLLCFIALITGANLNGSFTLILFWKIIRLTIIALYIAIIIATWVITKRFFLHGIYIARALLILTGIGLIIFIISPLPNVPSYTTDIHGNITPKSKRGPVKNGLYIALAAIFIIFWSSVVVTNGFQAQLAKQQELAYFYSISNNDNYTDCIIMSINLAHASQATKVINALNLTSLSLFDKEAVNKQIEAMRQQCTKKYPKQNFDREKYFNYFNL